MKRNQSFMYVGLVVGLAVGIFAGCASQKPAVESPGLASEVAPSWITATPISADTLFTVGVSNERGNIPIARKNAANAARVEMAQVLETKIKALFDGFMKEHADLIDPEAPATSEEFSRTVTRLATEATLVGSQIPQYWWDKANKLYYALAMVSRNSAANQIKLQTEDLIRQRKAAFAEENLDEALKRLDDALRNWDVSK